MHQIKVTNNALTYEIRARVQELDIFCKQPEVFRLLTKVKQNLISKISKVQPYSFETIDMLKFSTVIPNQVGSIRVAAFLPNAITKIERHPNSIQYLYSLQGYGKTKVWRNGQWETDFYGTNTKNQSLEGHWHFVAKNSWHQSLASGNIPWVLVAIHTASNVIDEYQ